MKIFVLHPSLGNWERKLFAPKKLMKLTVSHPYEIWGHQLLTEMILKLKWNWNDELQRNTVGLTSCLPCYQIFNKSTWIFYFWDIFWGIHSIWMLSLLLWMQLWLYMLRYVCGFPHFLIMSFNEVDKFLCFRKRVTSQGLIKKMFLDRS